VKVYNSSEFEKYVTGSAYLFFICAAIFVRSAAPYKLELAYRLIFILIILASALSFFRDRFCPFVIDEKGITNKLPGRDICMTWSKIKYIYVGERHYQWDYAFLMCFSKEPLERIYFDDFVVPNIQTKQRFYIVYREGMLDEILKYVDESKIIDVERIKNCPNPHEDQDYKTSMVKRIMDERDNEN